MTSRALQFFLAQRRIYGVCPNCEAFFRLSDCMIYTARKPKLDWLDSLLATEDAVNERKAKLSEAEDEIRCNARERGRREALKVVRKLDRVFAPRKIAPEDVAGIFHPVDYLVFNKQSTGETKSLIFLDRDSRTQDELPLQRSIETTVAKQRYEWKTLRVSNDGKVKQE